MAQCLYKNPKTGDQCKNTWPCVTPGDPMYGYCFAHATKLGLVPEEKIKQQREKQSLSALKARESPNWGKKVKEKRIEASEKLSEEKRRELEERQKTEKEAAQQLIHNIFGDQGYNAIEIVQEYKDANADFTYTDKICKFIFIGWFLSDPGTRVPGTLKELCTLLNMGMALGRQWIDSDWFATDLHNALKKTMKLAVPYLARVTLGRALGGDFKALQEFNKMFGKHEPTEGEEDVDDMFEEGVRDEVQSMEDH